MTTLILYRNCKILPWKNFSVDDLEQYLQTLSPVQAYSGQYIKHSLELTYKVELNIDELDFNPSIMNNYNYLMAQNNSNAFPTSLAGKPVYYFIVGKRWTSETCIELSLKMDTINTFKNLDISAKTTILRQHKNRWRRGSSPETFAPIVDLYSEGINPLLYKKKESTMFKEFLSGNVDLNSYYLIYRSHTTDEDSPIDLFLAFEEMAGIEYIAGTGFTGNVDTLVEMKSDWVGIIYGNDGDGNGTNDHGSIHLDSAINEITGDRERDINIQISSNTAVVFTRSRLYVGTSSLNGFAYTSWYKPYGALNFRKIGLNNIFRLRLDTSGSMFPYVSSYFTTLTPAYITGLSYASEIHGSSTTQISYVGTIHDVDRTDPLLLKIIKLPYCPIDLDMGEGNIISLPEDWEFTTGDLTFPSLLKYRGNNLTQSLEAQHMLISEDGEYESPFNAFSERGISRFGYLQPRSKNYETKLLHSDFYLQKFVYDSFVYDFIGEFMPVADGVMNLSIRQFTSTTMSSMFMFQFEGLEFTSETSGLGLKSDFQNYSNVMMITRNNELPVYNSAYLNYIRTGYNFDVKTKNRQMTSNIVQGVLSTAGAIAGFALSGFTGGTSAVAGVGLAVNALSKTYNAVAQTAQSEQNIQAKLRSAEMQGLSIVGSDDIDLLGVYTNGNKAKLVEYKVSEKMENALFDLFYYFGYIGNFQSIPDTTSRKVFNFVQADLILNSVPNLPKEIVDDIVERYRDGITFLHHYTLQDNLQEVRGWDFEQQYENWESNI